MRILVVEDDKKIAGFIVKGLTQAGFTADHAADGERGYQLASTEPYAAAVVDVMLPKRDGLSLIAATLAPGRRSAFPSSCSAPSAKWRSACAASRLGAMITSSNRSPFPSCWRACRRSCAAAEPLPPSRRA